MTTFSKSKGFGLVELMVGLVVGMFILLAVMGSAAFLEAQKRTTAGANGAVENLAQAVRFVGHGVRMAGQGMMFGKQLVCPKLNLAYKGTIISDGGFVPPVSLLSGGAKASDEITVVYGDGPIGFSKAALTIGMATPSDKLTVSTTSSVSVDKPALLIDTKGGGACTLVGISKVTGTGYGAVLDHSGGEWNSLGFTAPVTYSAGSSLIGLDSFTNTTFRIRDGRLEAHDNFTKKTAVLADDILVLKAYYGITDAIGNPAVTSWVEAIADWKTVTAALAPRIRAVRVALVSRSQKIEKQNEAGQCDATPTAPVAWAGGPPLDLSANPDWKCYRYRVADVALPLKNVILAGVY